MVCGAFSRVLGVENERRGVFLLHRKCVKKRGAGGLFLAGNGAFFFFFFFFHIPDLAPVVLEALCEGPRKEQFKRGVTVAGRVAVVGWRWHGWIEGSSVVRMVEK
jgi:hypothetical protein